MQGPEYQRPYLRHISAVLETHFPETRITQLDLKSIPSRSGRLRKMMGIYDLAFHSWVFGTRSIPAAGMHVNIAHGIDAGRFDALGSFSFGPGRLLKPDGKRVFDYVLTSGPWTAELAEEEVPAYQHRVLIVGDHRADRIRRLALDIKPCRKVLALNPDRPTIGISSTHGHGCLAKLLGSDILRILEDFKTSAQFIVFFHPFERIEQPSLYAAIQKYCSENQHAVLAMDGEAFDTHVAVCDAMIADIGSTSLYFSLLGKPMAFAALGMHPMLPHFPLMTLSHLVNEVSHTGDIGDFINGVVDGASWILSPPEHFIERLYPRGSNSSTLTREALAKILGSLNL